MTDITSGGRCKGELFERGRRSPSFGQKPCNPGDTPCRHAPLNAQPRCRDRTLVIRREFTRWQLTEDHMNKPYLDAFTVNEGISNQPSRKKQFYWTRIGAAFPTKQGSIIVTLDAMPAPMDGKYKIVLLPPKQKDDQLETDA